MFHVPGFIDGHSDCDRHTVLALKCFRRHMLLEICSKCEKVLKGAQNAK